MRDVEIRDRDLTLIEILDHELSVLGAGDRAGVGIAESAVERRVKRQRHHGRDQNDDNAEKDGALARKRCGILIFSGL